MKEKHRQRISLALFSSVLLGCNAGSQNSKAAAEQKPSIKNASLDSWELLGASAIYEGDREKAKIFLNSTDQLFDSDKIRVRIADGQVISGTDIVASTSSAADSLFTSVNIGGSYGLFRASAEFSLLSEEAKNSGAITIVSHGGYYANLQINGFTTGTDPVSAFSHSATALYLQGKEGRGWSGFTEKYGNAYVKQIPVTASYDRVIIISSDDTTTNQELKLKAELGYGNMFGLQAVLNTVAKKNNATVSVKIETVKKGALGDFDHKEWGTSNETPAIPISCENVTASESGLSTCLSQAATEDIKYQKAFEKAITSKYDDFVNRHNLNEATLSQFAYEMGNTLSVGTETTKNSKEYKYEYNNLPDMKAPAKDDLADEQKKIKENIRKAAALGKNSSFLNALQTKPEVYEALAKESGFNELMEKVNSFSVINNELFSPSRMLKLTMACFDAHSTLSTCNAYESKVEEYGPEGMGYQISLKSYFIEVEQVFKNAILNINGYYSNVTPIKANIFWMPITSNGVEKLIPIYLNDNFEVYGKKLTTTEANRLTDLNQKSLIGEKGWVFGDIDSNFNPLHKFLPLPEDLTVRVVKRDSESNIITVQRETGSSKLQAASYTQIENCSYQELPVLTNTIRNGSLKGIMKCSDAFGDYLDLAFTTKAVPFYETLQYTTDKPVIDRGHHIATGDSKYSIGGIKLEPDNPWCSPSGQYCLEYNSSGGLLTLTDGYQAKKELVATSNKKDGGGVWTLTLLKEFDGYNNILTYKNGDTTEKVLEENDYKAPLAQFLNSNYRICNGISVKDTGNVECIVSKDELLSIKDKAESQVPINSGGSKNNYIHDFLLADKMLNSSISKTVSGKYINNCTNEKVQNGTLSARCGNNMYLLNYDKECWARSDVSFINNDLRCVIPKDKQNSFTASPIWEPKKDNTWINKSNGTIEAIWFDEFGNDKTVIFNYNKECHPGQNFKIDINKKTTDPDHMISCAE